MIRPRVCVVDPCADSRELVDRVLGKHCELLLLDSPLYIMDALELFQPDLLITDLNLDYLNGFQLIQLLQADARHRRLPIMVLSGESSVDSQKQAYRLGAMHYQVKPCTPSQLFKAAALFMRLGSGEWPQRVYTAEQAERLMGERMRKPPRDPLLQQALKAHSRQTDDAALFERAIQASIARSRPRRAQDG